MRLSRYIQRTRALGDAEVPVHELEALEQAIEAGENLPQLLKRRSASSSSLTPRLLLGVWRAARAWREHQAYLAAVAERRREAGLPPIAPALLSQTVARHEVGVIERADALAPPGAAAEHRRRDAIKEALLLWNACLAVARREGRVRVELVTDDETLREELGDLVGTAILAEIPPYRWMAIRRGEKAGALRLHVDLPLDALAAQVEARRAALSALAGGRDARALLEALVLEDLVPSLLAGKDEEAVQRAIQGACDAYLGLLTAPRPKAELVAGVSVPRGGGEIGVAVVQRDGRLVHHGVAPVGDDPLATVERLIGGHPVEAIVLPTAAEDAELLKRLAGGFGPELPVIRMKATAMGEAVQHVEEDVPKAAARALVLARRAVRPVKYWGQIDPVSLGLAEYQHDLDPDRLREALNDMHALAVAGVKLEDQSRPVGGPAARTRPAVRAPAAPLNPLVKTVDDLRPGMTINGVVTNITQFGAFVNIGLPHEGLVHVSELAEHFVKDPNEVVRVGQSVSVRVLAVDRARGRISLSMKPERPRPTREDGGRSPRVPLDFIPGRNGGPPRDLRPRPNGGGTSRAQALAELEALFNKKK